MRLIFLPALLLSAVPCALAGTTSPLFARGYAVLPEPRQVTLGAGDFTFGNRWRVERSNGVAPDSSALRSLNEQLRDRYHLALEGNGVGGVVQLEMTAGAVNPGESQDKDHAAIGAQAYRLELKPERIRIIANADAGLFYGVQTLIQLLNTPRGDFRLPEGEIFDWPDLQLRQIYWDDAHHLEHLADLKAAVRQASFYKMNGFVIKLEGHFQYRSAPALVEPQALSPAELQDLTDFGLRHFVQVIPYLDAPAHIAFILKHPEYRPLRAFPDSNYELCTTNPDSMKLLRGMYDDLLAANRGVKYFYLSTDEAYYVGMANNSGCHEADRARELGSPGKVLAEFVSQAANYLHDQGRTVIFWGEYPLKITDIEALPKHLVNGETSGEPLNSAYKKHGIRQTIYGAIEGEEQLFPQYDLLPAYELMHPLHEGEQRVRDSIAKAISEPARQTSDLFGIVIAGWGDMGLHPETFWLGYVTVTAVGWNPSPGHTEEWPISFYSSFYGARISGMERAYQLLSHQAQVWTDTWERKDSTSRAPIWGNSEKIFSPAQPAHDASLQLPPVPALDLTRQDYWHEGNLQRMRMASKYKPLNDELIALLNSNMLRADTNRYNLEVLLSVAELCRENLNLLGSLDSIDESLSQARDAAAAGSPQKALAALDKALGLAQQMRQARNLAYRDAVETWSKSWLPRVAEANGRRFLYQVDDVKDHLPDRTVDMSYLIYRELQLPMEDWFERIQQVRNGFAHSHQLPEQRGNLNWGDLR